MTRARILEIVDAVLCLQPPARRQREADLQAWRALWCASPEQDYRAEDLVRDAAGLCGLDLEQERQP